MPETEIRRREPFEPSPFVPVDRECPSCGSTTWGLKALDWGGPSVAACYECHTDRPVRNLNDGLPPVVGLCWKCSGDLRRGQAVVRGTGGDTPLGGLAHPDCAGVPYTEFAE